MISIIYNSRRRVGSVVWRRWILSSQQLPYSTSSTCIDNLTITSSRRACTDTFTALRPFQCQQQRWLSSDDGNSKDGEKDTKVEAPADGEAKEDASEENVESLEVADSTTDEKVEELSEEELAAKAAKEAASKAKQEKEEKAERLKQYLEDLKSYREKLREYRKQYKKESDVLFEREKKVREEHRLKNEELVRKRAAQDKADLEAELGGKHDLELTPLEVYWRITPEERKEEQQRIRKAKLKRRDHAREQRAVAAQARSERRKQMIELLASESQWWITKEDVAEGKHFKKIVDQLVEVQPITAPYIRLPKFHPEVAQNFVTQDDFFFHPGDFDFLQDEFAKLGATSTNLTSHFANTSDAKTTPSSDTTNDK